MRKFIYLTFLIVFSLFSAVFTQTANAQQQPIARWYFVDKSYTTGFQPFDALSDRLAMEFDPAKRRALIIDMQKIIMEDAASLVFGYPETNMISSKAVANAKIMPCDYYWLTKDVAPAE